MQHDVGDAGDARETCRLVEIGEDWADALGSPESRLRRVA